MFSIFNCIFVWCGKSWYLFERIDDERRCHGSDHIYMRIQFLPRATAQRALKRASGKVRVRGERSHMARRPKHGRTVNDMVA